MSDFIYKTATSSIHIDSRRTDLQLPVLGKPLPGFDQDLQNTFSDHDAVLFGAGLSVACFWPSIQAYAADCLTVDHTMLFILLSCAGIPGFGFASWLMGIIGDQVGIRESFLVIPFLFAALVVIILVDSRIHRKAGRPAPS